VANDPPEPHEGFDSVFWPFHNRWCHSPLSSPSSSGRGLRFIDGLFTITSAACVMGLTVVDVRKESSLMGQPILLVWIQASGLGIMRLSTFVLAFGRKEAPFVLEDRCGGHLHPQGRRGCPLSTSRYREIHCGDKTRGGLILYLRFSKMFQPLEAIYFSAFHSVSAFCNAGFSLFSRSLEDFAGDPLVNFAIAWGDSPGGPRIFGPQRS